jgi:hypothetical protein
MNTFNMDMSGIAQTETYDHDEEIRSACLSQNLACQQIYTAKTALPADLANVNVEAFLCRMYAFQA